MLADAARKRQGIAVFDGTHRSALAMLLMLLVPLMVLLTTPFIRPFRWSRLFWTYLIPVLPLVSLFDGLVSSLRTYRVEELRALTEELDAENYQWEIGELKSTAGPIPITYLVGVPIDRAVRLEFPRLNNSSTEANVIIIETCRPPGSSLSERAKARIQQARGEPLFVADWDKVLMIHFAVNAWGLQPEVPFSLDLHEGRAFVTLVAFTRRRFRLRWGGALSQLLCAPIASHEFLNVRRYVTVNGEPGIHFLAEWLSSRLAVALGPHTFSLPYLPFRSDPISERLAARRAPRFGDLSTNTKPFRLRRHPAPRRGLHALPTRLARRMADGTLRGLQFRARPTTLLPRVASAVAAVPGGSGFGAVLVVDRELAVV